MSDHYLRGPLPLAGLAVRLAARVEAVRLDCRVSAVTCGQNILMLSNLSMSPAWQCRPRYANAGPLISLYGLVAGAGHPDR